MLSHEEAQDAVDGTRVLRHAFLPPRRFSFFLLRPSFTLIQAYRIMPFEAFYLSLHYIVQRLFFLPSTNILLSAPLMMFYMW